MASVINQTVARHLIDALFVNGVRRIFLVPGESFLAVLDALYDRPEIEVIVCRHEGAAAMMAEVHGKLTGQMGVAFVTRGPGFTNASSGLHVARQDSTSLLLFVGQIASGQEGRGAFQELDYRQNFGDLVKWSTSLDHADRATEIVSRAISHAISGRRGPVVVALPEDILVEMTPLQASRAVETAVAGVPTLALSRIESFLSNARQPMVIVGGSGWCPESCRQLARFVEHWHLPVCSAFRRADIVDNLNPNYVGTLGLGANPALLEAVRQSDLVLAIGTRLGDISTDGYTTMAVPTPLQTLIHLYPDPDEIGRVYAPDVAVVVAPGAAVAALADLTPPEDMVRTRPLADLRQSFDTWSTPPGNVRTNVDVGRIMEVLAERLPADAIVTNGAGNFSIWPNRYHRYRQLGTMLAPVSGSMGYGFPAAIAAKLHYRDRPVICFAGDGDFLMTGQEMATAAAYDVPVIIVLINNGMYGTIRMHQEVNFPGRVIATALHNPDFVRFAESFGATGVRVSETAQFSAALEQALVSSRSSLIELVVDPEMLTPTATVADIRARAGSA